MMNLDVSELGLLASVQLAPLPLLLSSGHWWRVSVGGGLAYIALWGERLLVRVASHRRSYVRNAAFLAVVAIAVQSTADNMFFLLGHPRYSCTPSRGSASA